MYKEHCTLWPPGPRHLVIPTNTGRCSSPAVAAATRSRAGYAEVFEEDTALGPLNLLQPQTRCKHFNYPTPNQSSLLWSHNVLKKCGTLIYFFFLSFTKCLGCTGSFLICFYLQEMCQRNNFYFASTLSVQYKKITF